MEIILCLWAEFGENNFVLLKYVIYNYLNFVYSVISALII